MKSNRRSSSPISSERAKTPSSGRYGPPCSLICSCASQHGWAIGKGRSADFLPSSRGCFGVDGAFRLCSSLSRRKKTACRRRSDCPTFSCSSTSATSEQETTHLTKPLFQNGSLSRSKSPLWRLFSFLWDICGYFCIVYFFRSVK